MKSFLITSVCILILSISYSYSKPLVRGDKVISRTPPISDTKSEAMPSGGIIIDNQRYNRTVSYVEQDSSKSKNEITKLYSRDQLSFSIEIQLEKNNYNKTIKLQIFNMLGNLVKGVYEGTAIERVEYTFDATNLPNGLYLCILEGPNFRDAEKFTISR